MKFPRQVGRVRALLRRSCALAKSVIGFASAVLCLLALMLAIEIPRARAVEGDIPPPMPATFAGNIYGLGPTPTVPVTKYDDQRQSVFILDGPAPAANSASAATSGSATGPAMYQPGQQFQLLDAPHAGNAPVAFNTIEAPSLPPGAALQEEYDHDGEPWSWQVAPDGLIWHSALAGPKEPRIGGQLVSDTGVDTKLDGTVGGRVGLFRYGDTSDFRPQGWQFDAEGAAFIRQDLTQNSDVDAYDFRIGFPITYGWGDYQMKIAWYHTSAHVGDEFELKHPTFMRINYSRNAIVWGNGYFITPDIRVYSEFEWAYFADGGSKPFAVQFGVEYNPLVRGWHGAPFFDINAYLKQETDWGGPLTVEAGWQWRPLHGGQMIRTGFFYQTGPTIYGQFFTNSEQLIGYGLWYDY